MLLFVCHNREDEVSPPSTFLTVMTKDETVQLLSCDSASTCADEVSDHALLTPIVCKPASVVDHTYTISQMTENTPTETKVTLVTSRGQPVGMGSVIGGDVLHGKRIPSDYTKVAIEYIKPGTMPCSVHPFIMKNYMTDNSQLGLLLVLSTTSFSLSIMIL